MAARLSPSCGSPACESLPRLHCPEETARLCRRLECYLQPEFFQVTTRRCWARHEILFRAGDQRGPVFKVTTGVVAISKSLRRGERQIVRFALPGDICGDLSVEGYNSFDGEAITEGVITRGFDRDEFDDLVAREPAADEAVRLELSALLVQVGLHLAAVGRLPAPARVADFLCEMQAAFEARGLQSQSLTLPMTQADLGDYLGMRVETVNRALTELSRDRLIKPPRGKTVVIVDPAGLAMVARRRQPVTSATRASAAPSARRPRRVSRTMRRWGLAGPEDKTT